MSKAEERAYECFPNEDVESKKARFGFLLGYHQAEKDLEIAREELIENVCKFLDGYSFIPTYVIIDLKQAMKDGNVK